MKSQGPKLSLLEEISRKPEKFKEQVKLGFTRACRSIDKLGKKWLKTR